MFKVTQNLVKYSKNATLGQAFLRFNNLTTVPITVRARNLENENGNESSNETLKSSNPDKLNSIAKTPGGLVAAAFASLRTTDDDSSIKSITPFTDGRIAQAKTIEEVLSISEGNGISRRLALKIVSVLADWSTSGKIQLLEFETDPRFIRLCKILTKGNYVARSKPVPLRNEDWSTILNITADDEAAKLISSISLSQMVKVMSTLSVKKRRSTPLLRSLAFNIARNSEKLDLKQSADLLYSAAVLNFFDGNLLEKICSDICGSLADEVKGSAVIGSILTSLGHLRYKDTVTLDALSEWVFKNFKDCRPQEIFSLFITLAILNHQAINSEELYRVLIPILKISEVSKVSVWLDMVWSLVVLNQACPEHISSVLCENFITRIEGDIRCGSAAKLKLLNIDGACGMLLKDYTGPRLSENSSLKKTEITRTKNKEVLVSTMQDSLSNLINIQTHSRTNVDTGMGFYIDAELVLDKKRNPVALNKPGETDSENYRVAVMVYDYHDMCRGRIEPTGISALFTRLLEAQGYCVLSIPFNEFSPKDKLVNRVQYLEAKLKSSS